jgi:hypothetical protein
MENKIKFKIGDTYTFYSLGGRKLNGFVDNINLSAVNRFVTEYNIRHTRMVLTEKIR